MMNQDGASGPTQPLVPMWVDVGRKAYAHRVGAPGRRERPTTHQPHPRPYIKGFWHLIISGSGDLFKGDFKQRSQRDLHDLA